MSLTARIPKEENREKQEFNRRKIRSSRRAFHSPFLLFSLSFFPPFFLPLFFEHLHTLGRSIEFCQLVSSVFLSSIFYFFLKIKGEERRREKERGRMAAKTMCRRRESEEKKSKRQKVKFDVYFNFQKL